MSDFSVIVVSLAVIVLCWAVVRINQKVDEMNSNPLSFRELDVMEEKSEPAEMSPR